MGHMNFAGFVSWQISNEVLPHPLWSFVSWLHHPHHRKLFLLANLKLSFCKLTSPFSIMSFFCNSSQMAFFLILLIIQCDKYAFLSLTHFCSRLLMNMLDRASLDKFAVRLHWWYLSTRKPWPFIPVLYFLSFHQSSFLVDECIPIPRLLRCFKSLEAQLSKAHSLSLWLLEGILIHATDTNSLY